MTIRMDAAEVMTAIEVASWVGSIVAMLVAGLIVYLMVRPKRRRRDARPTPTEDVGFDSAEMLRLMERMERRLETMERAVAARAPDEERILLTGAQGPEMRRRK